MDIVDIAMICTSDRCIYLKPQPIEQLADVARMRIGATCSSDHIAMVDAFNAYTHVERMRHDGKQIDLELWCSRRFLDIRALELVREKRERFGSYLKKDAKLKPSRASTKNITVVAKALATAFCTQIAFCFNRTGEYRTVHDNVPALIGPRSAALKRNHTLVMFNSITLTGGKFILDTVTAIRADWIIVSNFHPCSESQSHYIGSTLLSG